ncbi:MAG TPA: hypothetical protein DCG19_08315 [Cryomorphaceae bacterium]|nr:hypothetical protein [Owenweeksia sp.]HAD97397.1 hypothetical protein [Cryomorphaceae bacterium]HBF18955.1 hypothetical protein [Cryomorphaceae bacterium]|tara:strand:- start:772 stop:1413 length:642 start_codon:yes stop_codon:yes gene_type:complete
MIHLVTILLVALLPQRWQNSDYDQYRVKEFFEREDVNQPIDLEKPDRELLDAAVFYASNEARKSQGKETLLFDPTLRKAALQHSENMRQQNFISHENPHDRNLRTPMLRIDKAGGEFEGVAENIARVNVYILGKRMEFFVDEQGRKIDQSGNPLKPHTYASLARMVVDGWMHSKGHRRNLLGDYNYLGCATSGIIYSSQGIPEILITQNFGKK